MISKRAFGFLIAAGIAVSADAQPATKLPPKQKKTPSAQELGESRAVDEVNRMTEKSAAANEAQSTETSGAVPPVMISPAVVNSLNSSAAASTSTEKVVVKEEPKKEESAPKVSSVELEEKGGAPQLPQTRLWLVLDKKPELGFLTGWAFTRKELSTLVGDGFSYGFLAAQEIQPGIQAQLRISGSHHREEKSDRTSSLNLFPFEVLAQFSRAHGNLRFYVQPGMGGAAWAAKSVRLVDQREQKTKGFDFMASAGLGFKYKTKEVPWSLGADVSMAYVSGYFDNYFNRILVYTTYQF